MNTPEPREYQANRITKISDALSKLLKNPSHPDRIVVLKAPTGSGKTLMAAYALANTYGRPQNRPFIVLWLSPGKGKLHQQSARALTFLLANSPMDVKLLEDRDDIISNARPVAGTVFVANWEKLRSEKDGEWANKMLRPGETANFFTMLQNASNDGLDLIVVIDESHTQLDGPQTSKLMKTIRDFRTFIQFEISATPNTTLDEELREEGLHHWIPVPFREVEEAGMVRRSALLNPEFSTIQSSHPNDPLDLQVLWAAWERTEQLRLQYENAGSNVKPLLLIQYPDGSEAKARAEVVEKFLTDRGLVANKTYATWLSEEHSPDLDKIANNNSPYEALIFKQAIATGWDCPRAQVLVQFRKPGSKTFQIQTLGRLMRTPEQMHYEDEALNVAYVYSDLAGLSVQVTSDDPDFGIRDTTVVRGRSYPPNGIRLQSIFQPRRRDFHYPEASTLEPLLRTELDTRIKPILPENPLTETRQEVLVDAELNAQDVIGGDLVEFEGELLDGVLGEQFVQALFDQVLTSQIGPYRSREQSRSRIKTAIIKWFQQERQWQPDEIQHFTIAFANEMTEAINAACFKSAHSEEAKAIAEARSKRRTNTLWEVPALELVAGKNFEATSLHGYVMEPSLLPAGRSNPEKRFEKWVGTQAADGKVVWWWKNGSRDEKYLGIPYRRQSVTGEVSDEITYPDYLVMCEEGTLWVLEVKDLDDPDGEVGGITSQKAKGLSAWAKALNASRSENPELLDFPMVSTGVVVPTEGNDGTIVLKINARDEWHAPSPSNYAVDKGWHMLKINGENE